ncbi:MAG TPA: type II secretion system protein [Candidatus Paceibacterota bacterium]|nr:type II secretion system protein [Candidatus Paceibacterota bacterium]
MRKLLSPFSFHHSPRWQAQQEGTPLGAGFTLIEMLVVVAIIAIISSVVLFNYSDFSTNVSVRNLAQEVALSVRKAQVYATSVRTLDGTQNLSSKTFPGYGISFSNYAQTTDSNAKATPSNRQFIIFADNFSSSQDPSYGVYNQSDSDECGTVTTDNECLESVAITTADKVSDICVQYNNTSTETCLPPGSRIDISFDRPNPDALLCSFSSGKRCDISYAKIVLQSAKGLERTVEIWNTGQISVQ